MVQMENIHLTINNTHHHQHVAPPSPPYNHHQQAFSFMHQQPLHMQPSFSAPIIGTSSNNYNNQHYQKSWPDVFFGGRDLFDTLPIRRASSSTQHAFEFIPNSTTTTSGDITVERKLASSSTFMDSKSNQNYVTVCVYLLNCLL
jgi:hypothetical protein